MKKIGIIGGLGVETGCIFYTSINNKIYGLHKIQPEIIMVNIPVPSHGFQKLVYGDIYEELYTQLERAVTDLNKLGVDLIAIPCNTVHIFIEKLRKYSQVPLLSIIDTSTKECSQKGFKKVGLLASTTSIKHNLHKKALEKYEIETLLPDKKEQYEIAIVIQNILELRATENDVMTINKIAKSLAVNGSDCILLGCTDLRTIANIDEICLPVVESTSSLEKMVVDIINKG